MHEVYLNQLASAFGSRIEHNDAATLGQAEADCERIVKKTGVYRRPIAAQDEYTGDLALRAARQLMQLGLAAAEVDTLLVCTQTPDHLIPGVSSRLHGALELPQHCYALDINQGCSGFIYGLQLIAAMLRSGQARSAVLLNADCYSRLIRPDDLTTRVLFGDAAAASSFSTRREGFRLLHSQCYSDGTGYGDFVARGSAMMPDLAEPPGIHMNGPGILNFALRVVPKAVDAALQAIGRRAAEIKMFAFHQANSFVIGKLAYKMGLQESQVPQNCATLGNTVSASIPLLLLERRPALAAGDIVVAVGFGVGLSWGVAAFEYVGNA